MMLFRAAQQTDLEGIHELSKHCGIGITTLPQDRAILHERLTLSSASFYKNVCSPHNEYYLFVLEEPSTRALVGVSAIEALTGSRLPFYSYKLSKQTKVCYSLNIRSDYQTLTLVNDNQGWSELCTLFLEPTFRRDYNGLLLSLARFLFIAHHPNRFSSRIIAEIRGVSDKKGNSPFWESLGRHFFHMSFAEADQLTLSTNKQFIADLIPRNPIYVNLLPAEAQAVIGKPHHSTVAAMNILVREGFHYNHYVDIFDAGPTLNAPIEHIHTIAHNQLLTIKQITEKIKAKRYLLANTRLDFRATMADILIHEMQTCSIDQETAELLEVKQQDCVRVVPLELVNQ